MLIEQLAIAYKCHSSIGNSVNLKEMIHEVLKTFVSESYAIYSEFLLLNDENESIKIDSFGRISNFDSNKYKEYKNSLELIVEDEIKVLKINLDNGIIFLVSKNLTADCSFFASMFESLIPKLNISVNACINFEKLEQTNKFLEDQKKELIKANKTKDDFLANMSHELKTPLNSINIISEVMVKNKSENLDEKQVKNLEIINKCGKDLLLLINDVLDLSKLDAKENPINNSKINIKKSMTSIYEMFYSQVKAKDLELIFEVDNDLDFIYSDNEKIKQIVKNLLSNAIKFTQKGRIHFLIKNHGDNLKIIIQDEGIGIPQDKLEFIFDRFKQLDGSTKRKYGGTGLGLTICKELVSLLNGKISVSSKIDVGSIFEIIIPKNSQLATSLDNEDNQTKVSNEEKSIEEISKFEVSSKNVEKETIYILNNDPISFLNIIIELNKKYSVKQLSKIEQLESIENKNSKLIVDITKLNDEQINQIENLSFENLVILYEDNISDELKNKNLKVYKKPLNHENLISL